MFLGFRYWPQELFMRCNILYLEYSAVNFKYTDTQDNLQKAAYKLNQIITEYGLTISVQKTKSIAFKGRDTVRTEIVIDNEIIEQVNSFNCLGNMISYEKRIGH